MSVRVARSACVARSRSRYALAPRGSTRGGGAAVAAFTWFYLFA
jgi:hypothetical protein